MAAANVKSPEWRQLARSILESKATPLVLFEFQLDLIPEDQFTKLKASRYGGRPKIEKGCYAIRADAIAFDPWKVRQGKGPIRILEIKSSRSDFTSDSKWTRYLPYCTQFAFLAPDDCIKPSELPAGVGMFVPKLMQLKHHHDAADGSYKAGDVWKEMLQPHKVKQWNTRVMTPERRKVILNRLISRGIAELYHNQRSAERLFYGCDPEYLKTLEECEAA